MNNNEDKELKSKLWKSYIIIMGVIIGGSIVIWIGEVAWNGIQNFLRTQDSSISQSKVEVNQSSISETLTPDGAIVSHYKLIDDKELEKSWSNLSPSFKGSNLTKGFNEYIEWWNSVDKVYISDVQVIKNSGTSSVVKADLSYKLRSGRIINDTRPYIYLVWVDGKWLINGKSETDNN